MYFDLIILILSSQTLGQNANFSLSQLKECVSGPIIWSNCRMQGPRKFAEVFLSQWFMKNKLYSILNFYIRLDLVLIFMTILEPLVLSILSSMEHGLELTKYLENGSSKKILGMIYMIRWSKWWEELRHLRIIWNMTTIMILILTPIIEFDKWKLFAINLENITYL